MSTNANSTELSRRTAPRGLVGTQARYWIGTIPANEWTPQLPSDANWVCGQLERGNTTGYEHFQIVVSFPTKRTRRQVLAAFPGTTGHFEPTRSSAANDYVIKEDTRIGEPFEFGSRPFKRNSAVDWDRIRVLATTGDLEQIPSEVFVRHYYSLSRIRADYSQPIAIQRQVYCFWGPSGTGKSHRAWDEAGNDAYSKDPRSKFWCGYDHQRHVVLDEFRGAIDISHLLRWLDKYPVSVEIKGSSRPLVAEKIWITSNLHPQDWYPDLDAATLQALLRRMQVTYFSNFFNPQ